MRIVTALLDLLDAKCVISQQMYLNDASDRVLCVRFPEISRYPETTKIFKFLIEDLAAVQDFDLLVSNDAHEVQAFLAAHAVPFHLK